MEAGFALEPLAGEAEVDRGAGGGADAAEGEVGGGPDLGAGRVGAEDGAADVVGSDEGEDTAFDDDDGGAVQPDIFADQGAGGFVVFCDAVTLAVEHRVDGDPTRQCPDRLPPGEIVFGAGFWGAADAESRGVTRVL